MKPEKQNTKSGLIVYGRHAVMAALENSERQIGRLLCTKETVAELKGKLAENKISVVDKREIDKLLPRDAVHQGFALMTQPLKNYPLDDICAATTGYVLILDQVTDPQNVGAIVRSAAAFGALGIIVQDKNSPQESGAMLKAAAGTFEKMPFCRVTNLARAIEQLKKSGFWIVGMDGYAKENIDKLDKSGKLAVIMGSEGKGMRRLVEENCDITVRLPIAPEVESLNVSTAAAVVLYELARQ